MPWIQNSMEFCCGKIKRGVKCYINVSDEYHNRVEWITTLIQSNGYGTCQTLSCACKLYDQIYYIDKWRWYALKQLSEWFTHTETQWWIANNTPLTQPFSLSNCSNTKHCNKKFHSHIESHVNSVVQLSSPSSMRHCFINNLPFVEQSLFCYYRNHKLLL